MGASEFIIVAAIVVVGLIFLVVSQKFIFGSQEETKDYKYKAEGDGLVSLINRVLNEPASHVSYFQYISLSNITVRGSILTYEREGTKYSFQVPKNVSDVYLEETTSVCIVKIAGKISLSDKCPTCNLNSFCEGIECKENCPDCSGPDKICIGDGFCNINIRENCKNSDDCKCESGTCCPDGQKINGMGCLAQFNYLSEGEKCGCDGECQKDYICANKDENRCCPNDKMNWCKKPREGEPRCMSDTEYGNDCKPKCKKIYKLVVAANNAPSMSEYKARTEREVAMFLRESPWRECPDCIKIEITDINCQNGFMDYGGLTVCVSSQVKDYNMIHIVDYSGICNGYCTGIGGSFTICSNNLPSGISDSCFSHELGHCMGYLCDEYGHGTWMQQGCSPSDWPGAINARSSSGCKVFNCDMNDACCGSKLKPSDSSDNTVDIMGGGGGIITCNKNGGMYTAPIHFRDWTYERFKNSIPLNNYCG